MAVPRYFVLLVSCAPLLLALLAGEAGAQTSTFRIADLDLRDPHLFVDVLGCRDVTDVEFGGFAFNPALQAGIEADGDGDGALDLSFLLSFMPLAQDQASNFLALGTGTCSAPLASTRCWPIETPIFADDVLLDADATCLDALPGTTRPYAPAIAATPPACFVGPPTDLTLNLDGIVIPLRDARIAARFDGAPAGQLLDGLLRGFITEADANATLLPASYPLVGGQPLSLLLPGGTGNCAAYSDQDTHGVQGWWFYFNFHAVRVEELGDPVFADGFEALP